VGAGDLLGRRELDACAPGAHGRPAVDEHPLVRGVSAARTVSGVTHIVSRATSQKTGRAPAGRDRLARGVERERRHDHVVTGPDAHGAQRDRQRVGAVGDADGVIGARARELLLEGRDLGPRM
jgi:hypothetical protein